MAAAAVMLAPPPVAGTVALNWESGACDLQLSSSLYLAPALARGGRPRPSLCFSRELHIHRLFPDGRPRSHEVVGLPVRVRDARRLLSPPRAARAVFADMVRAMEHGGLGLPDAALDCLAEQMAQYARHVAVWAAGPGAAPLLAQVCAAVHVSVFSEEGDHYYGDQEQLPSLSAASMSMETAGVGGQLLGGDSRESGAGRRDEDGEEEEEECCAICLESMAGRERRWLQCSHAFHPGCIGSWLREKAECPLCRLQVTDRGASGCSMILY